MRALCFESMFGGCGVYLNLALTPWKNIKVKGNSEEGDMRSGQNLHSCSSSHLFKDVPPPWCLVSSSVYVPSFLLTHSYSWRNALGISSLKTSLSWPQIPCSHHSISLRELASLLSSHPTAISPLTSHLLCGHPRLSRVPANGICLQKTEHKGFLFTPILVSQQSSMMLN